AARRRSSPSSSPASLCSGPRSPGRATFRSNSASAIFPAPQGERKEPGAAGAGGARLNQRGRLREEQRLASECRLVGPGARRFNGNPCYESINRRERPREFAAYLAVLTAVFRCLA